MRRTSMVALVVALVAGGCSRAKDAAVADDRGRDNSVQLVANLRAFDECDELLDYLRREGAAMVGPYGFDGGYGVMGGGGFLAATPLATTGGSRAAAADEAATAPQAAQADGGESFSTTNVQEAGVDEADIVKTDGRRLVAFGRGKLQVLDVSGDSPRLVSALAVAQPYQEAELFLVGDRVLVLRHAETEGASDTVLPDAVTSDVAGDTPQSHRAESARTKVTVVDISDMTKPRVASEVTLAGSLVSARLVDGVARLVLRLAPPRLDFERPTSEQDIQSATEANRRAVEQSDLDDWLGGYSYEEPGRDEAKTSGRMTECRDVRRPQQFSGLDMVTVVAVDPADARPGPAATVVGVGEVVYASATSLYVTSDTRSQAAPEPVPEPAPLPQPGPLPEPGAGAAPDLRTPPSVVPRPTSTDVHKFDISDEVTTRYVGSGRVRGQVLNQFSISEHEGHLRLATTVDEAGESQVTVLRENDGGLTVVGEVAGLGKGERIYSVRFLGDRGYVVTFRQTDPLYVIDLADPTKPSVRGELKIPGYSAYLHPIGDDRLLGVGQEATDQGRTLGTQVSLFDVSEPGDPKRLANAVLPGADSEAEYDHRAFLYWAKTGVAVLPVESYGNVGIGSPGRSFQRQFVGAVGFRVSAGEVTEAGRLRQRDGQPIRRSLVVGDRLLTLSEGGLLTSDVGSLAERSWLGF